MPSKRPICFCYGTGCSVHSQSASIVELAANAHPEANGLVDLDLNVLHYLGSGIYIFVPSKSTMLWPSSFPSNQQAKHYGIGCKLQAYIQIANPLLLWDWLQVYIQKLKDYVDLVLELWLYMHTISKIRWFSNIKNFGRTTIFLYHKQIYYDI